MVRSSISTFIFKAAGFVLNLFATGEIIATSLPVVWKGLFVFLTPLALAIVSLVLCGFRHWKLIWSARFILIAALTFAGYGFITFSSSLPLAWLAAASSVLFVTVLHELSPKASDRQMQQG